MHHAHYKHMAQCTQVPSAQTGTCTIIPVPFAQPVPRALAGLTMSLQAAARRSLCKSRHDEF